MSELIYRRTLFVALLLAAPALIFLVQAFFIVPTVFVVAGVGYMAQKFVLNGFRGEDLTFLAFFSVHLVVFAGIYYGLAWGVGKLVRLLPNGWARRGFFALSLGGLLWVTQLPLYGGGGHGPGKLGPLQYVLGELEQTYGARAIGAVYFVALALALLPAGWVWWKRRRLAPLESR